MASTGASTAATNVIRQTAKRSTFGAPQRTRTIQVEELDPPSPSAVHHSSAAASSESDDDENEKTDRRSRLVSRTRRPPPTLRRSTSSLSLESSASEAENSTSPSEQRPLAVGRGARPGTAHASVTSRAKRGRGRPATTTLPANQRPANIATKKSPVTPVVDITAPAPHPLPLPPAQSNTSPPATTVPIVVPQQRQQHQHLLNHTRALPSRVVQPIRPAPSALPTSMIPAQLSPQPNAQPFSVVQSNLVPTPSLTHKPLAPHPHLQPQLISSHPLSSHLPTPVPTLPYAATVSQPPTQPLSLIPARVIVTQSTARPASLVRATSQTPSAPPPPPPPPPPARLPPQAPPPQPPTQQQSQQAQPNGVARTQGELTSEEVQFTDYELVNITTLPETDIASWDRFIFFSHRPQRFQLAANGYLSSLSPFSAVTSDMKGVNMSSVCAVCGGSDNLHTCVRCQLGFHRLCLSQPKEVADRKPWLCTACLTVMGNDHSTCWNPSSMPSILPPPSSGLARLTLDAIEGNPIDSVFNPSLFNFYIREAGCDWLRCSKCQRVRTVGSGVLAESVRIPFDCSGAFWLPESQRVCPSAGSNTRSQSEINVERFIRQRSRRRSALFALFLGEDDREDYGYPTLAAPELAGPPTKAPVPVPNGGKPNQREIIVLDEDPVDVQPRVSGSQKGSDVVTQATKTMKGENGQAIVTASVAAETPLPRKLSQKQGIDKPIAVVSKADGTRATQQYLSGSQNPTNNNQIPRPNTQARGKSEKPTPTSLPTSQTPVRATPKPSGRKPTPNQKPAVAPSALPAPIVGRALASAGAPVQANKGSSSAQAQTRPSQRPELVQIAGAVSSNVVKVAAGPVQSSTPVCAQQRNAPTPSKTTASVPEQKSSQAGRAATQMVGTMPQMNQTVHASDAQNQTSGVTQSAPGSKEAVLELVAALDVSEELEDQLTDMALAGDMELVQLFSVYGKNASKFKRHASRLAQRKISETRKTTEALEGSTGQPVQKSGNEGGLINHASAKAGEIMATPEQNAILKALLEGRRPFIHSQIEFNRTLQSMRVRQFREAIALQNALAAQIKTSDVQQVSALYSAQLEQLRMAREAHEKEVVALAVAHVHKVLAFRTGSGQQNQANTPQMNSARK